MAIADLWPSDFGQVETVPPVTILKQQAMLIGQRTQGLVVGQVSTLTSDFGPTDDTRMMHNFWLVAPALDNYRYLLFTIRHDISLYPVDIFLTTGGNGLPEWCQNEDAFVAKLRDIFALPATRQVIASLLAQSTA